MKERKYQVVGYRWVMLATFSAVAFVAGMGFNAVAPMMETMAERWVVSR